MLDKDLASRQDPLAHCRLPVAFAGGHPDRAYGVIDLRDDDVDHTVEDLILVGHVVVERHRFHPEFLGKPAHGQSLDPALIGHLNGRAQHSIFAQRDSGPGGSRIGCRSHVFTSRHSNRTR
jgi:hypothetical protein